MASDPPKVLISYSHDSPQHAQHVLELANRLRADGIDCTIDQYFVAPAEGWPRWMDQQIRDSDFVVMVCTETYYQRVMGEEKLGKGLGVRWEGHLIYQAIYSAESMNTKFIPVLFESGNYAHIPVPVQSTTFHFPQTEDGYEDLYRRLTNQPHALKPALGKLRSLPPAERKSEGTADSAVIFPNFPGLNPFFTGRERVLAQLREALAAHGRAVLSGLGGIGKTQASVEYAQQHLTEYAYAFWAKADSRESLISGYVRIAELLKLPESKDNDQTLAVDAFKRWLNSHERWLLILDNADDIQLAHEFIPTGNNGHVILTTRARAVGAIAGLVEIREMGIEEGALFILRRAKYIAETASLEAATQADQAIAKEITTQLDGLPLALDQAAAYIEETACGLSGYLKLYRDYAPELLRRRGMVASDHPDPVATTWALSFENIEKANLAAAELLRFCAFLHPDAIPEDVFHDGAAELGPELEALGSNAMAFNDALSEILKYSLLSRDPEDGTVKIHRLVQAVLRHGMDDATERLWAERGVRAVARSFPTGEFSNWSLCERLLPQARACAELVSQDGFEFPLAAQLLDNAGSYLLARGRYVEIESLYQRALSIYEKALGPEHRVIAGILNNLGMLYVSQGQYAKADPVYQRALAIREKELGPSHLDVASSLNNLAILAVKQGQYGTAEARFERALTIQETVLSPDHPDVARKRNNLASLYYNQGKYATAERLFDRSLATLEKALGPEHLDVAGTLNNLALVYLAQGQYVKAEPLLERAVAILEKVLDPDHPSMAATLNSLADCYANQGQYAKAEPLYERALAIREKALGPEHPNVATSLTGLAGLYAKQGQYAKAKPLYKRALAIREKALGSEHPDVAVSLTGLAGLYVKQGQYAKAEPLYKRTLAIWEKALGPDHPDVATSVNNIAAIYYNQGQYQKAESFYQRASEICQKALGPDHPHVANSFNNLGLLAAAQGQYAKAESLFQRALSIYENALGPDHPDVANSLNNLGVLYFDHGKYALAEPASLRALAIREKSLGVNHPEVAGTLSNLAALYQAQGQYAEALSRIERALEIYEQTLAPDHPNVAVALENYASLLRKMDRPQEAEPLEARARAIRAKTPD